MLSRLCIPAIYGVIEAHAPDDLEKNVKELQFIEAMLRETAAYVRERYADRGAVEVTVKKEASDLLTEVDLEVQRRVVARLAKEFPSDFVVAEEFGLDRNPTDPGCRCWLLDPIDGTQNFVRGLFPIFGTSLAFAVGGETAAGGIILPIGEDLFLSERGAGAVRNGKPLRVSTVNDIRRAKLEFDFVRLSGREEALGTAREALRSFGAVRSKGCAVAALCSIASGDADAYLHVGLQPWDYAAGALIVAEAGGKSSRLDGSPIAMFDGRRGLLASNGLLHETMVGLIEGRTDRSAARREGR